MGETMKKILAYIFVTLLSLMIGMPVLGALIMMIIYDTFMFFTIVGCMIIFVGGVWGFAYLWGPTTKDISYEEECGFIKRKEAKP